jgi:nucleoside 2-deoxyribosyltransferase
MRLSTGFLLIGLIAIATASRLTTTDTEALKNIVRAEIRSTLEDAGWFDFIPQQIRNPFQEVAKGVQKISNEAVDKVQSDLNKFSSSDAGVFNIIP